MTLGLCRNRSFNAYLPDLAFTCSAARRSGVKIRKAVMVTVETAPDMEDMFAQVALPPKESGILKDLTGDRALGNALRPLSLLLGV